MTETSTNKDNSLPRTLVDFEGKFGRDTGVLDLKRAGVLGMRVRVLRDVTTGVLCPKAGETGVIGSAAYVGLSIFDLAVEAPVTGLPTKPDAVIGIRWDNLERFDGEVAP